VRRIGLCLGVLGRLLSWYVVLSVPLLLLLTAVQLVTSEVYLRLEYSRLDFPADMFGFTLEDRLLYASYAVSYLRNDEGIDYLAELVFPDGRVLYNERELRHMGDVKVVFGVVFDVYLWLVVFFVVSVILLFLTTRRLFFSAIQHGGFLTLGLIITLVVLVTLRWDLFFELFHRLFFADGTWRFEYSDTLIRLFPEKFWFDTALNIGLFTAGSAMILIAIGSWAGRKTGRQHRDES